MRECLSRGRRTRRVATVAVSVLGTVATASAGAQAASSVTTPFPTIWPGWTAVGQPTQSGTRAEGTDGTSLSVSGGDDNAFAAARGGDTLLGTFEDRALRQGHAGNPVVLSSGRLVVTTGGAVGTSDDLGRHWRIAPLPSAAPRGLRPVFSDALHGIVVSSQTPPYSVEQPLPSGTRRGPGVFATTDGGLSWQTVIEPEPEPTTARTRPTDEHGGREAAVPRTNDGGPPEPQPRITVTTVGRGPGSSYLRALRINRAGPGDEAPATALERSDDQGATWRRIWTLPAPTGGYQPAAITSFGLLPSGNVLAALTDGFNTSTQTARPILVINPDTGETTAFETPGIRPRIDCDRTGECTVRVGDGNAASTPLRKATFDGTTFGPVTPDPFVAQDGASVVLHDHHVVVRASRGGWTVTRDGRRFTAVPTPPVNLEPTAIAQSPGGLVALFEDGTVWQLKAGRWDRLVDASSLKPSSVAATGPNVIVVGDLGIARVVDKRLVREIRHQRGRTIGVTGAVKTLSPRFSGVDVKSSTVVAWASDYQGDAGKVVRSTDSGRTWRQLRDLPTAEDVQQLSTRTIVASRGPALMVSRDRGRSFSVAGYTDTVTEFGYPASFLHFRSLTHGVMSTNGGSFITSDGGRTFQALPRPDGPAATFARVTSRGLVTDGPLGTVLQNAQPFAAVRKTSIRAHITDVDREPNGRLRVTFEGTARGIPDSAELFTLTSRPGGGPPVYQASATTSVSVDANGRFSGEVAALPGRRIRLRYGGQFDNRPFRGSALSESLLAPRAPRGS